jgi:hypothetical protein
MKWLALGLVTALAWIVFRYGLPHDGDQMLPSDCLDGDPDFVG